MSSAVWARRAAVTPAGYGVNGDRDGCCPRCLRLERATSLLFLFTVNEIGGEPGNPTLEAREGPGVFKTLSSCVPDALRDRLAMSPAGIAPAPPSLEATCSCG